MEMALPLINIERYKRLLLIAIVVTFGVLMPSVAFADLAIGGFDTEKLIGMTGVSDSQLLIGRSTGPLGLFHIAMGGTHFHEDDPAFQIVSLAPLLYAGMLVFVLVGLFVKMDLKTIIIGVVAIYLAISLLGGMQTLITDLLR